MNLTRKLLGAPVQRSLCQDPSFAAVHTHFKVFLKAWRAENKGASFRHMPAGPVFAMDDKVLCEESKKAVWTKAKALAGRSVGSMECFPAGRGIGPYVMVEEGLAFPGTRVSVADNAAATLFGGVGCLGMRVSAEDTAHLWVYGRCLAHAEEPRVLQVQLQGSLPPDASIDSDWIATHLPVEQLRDENIALEFTGAGVASLSIDQRITVAHHCGVHLSATSALFPVDDTTIQWVQARTRYYDDRSPLMPHPQFNDNAVAVLLGQAPRADANASYDGLITWNLSESSPSATCSTTSATATSITSRCEAYLLLTCEAEVAQAAHILVGRHVHECVDLYVIPATSQVQERAEIMGYWNQLLVAGAKPLPSATPPSQPQQHPLLISSADGASAAAVAMSALHGKTQ